MKRILFVLALLSFIHLNGCAQYLRQSLTQEQIHQKYLAQNPSDYARDVDRAELQKRMDEQHQYAQEQRVKRSTEEAKPSASNEDIARIIGTDIFYVPYQQFSDGTPATIFLTGKHNKQCSSFGVRWYVANMRDLENKKAKDVPLCWAVSESIGGRGLLMNPSTGSAQSIPTYGVTQEALKNGALNVFNQQESQRQQAQFQRVLKANCGAPMNECPGQRVYDPSIETVSEYRAATMNFVNDYHNHLR